MSDIMNTKEEADYWSLRYQEDQTGWDIGYISTPIKNYIDQLDNKDLKILIPGAGNGYEAEYLYHQGFKQVYVLDITAEPLDRLQKKVPDMAPAQFINENFFEHRGVYDLIIEQTFFCSFPPTKENRSLYALHMSELLDDKGKLAGLWFDIPLTGDMIKRPFGGDKSEYLSYLTQHFDVKTFERCYNSIQPRQGYELFGIFVKRR